MFYYVPLSKGVYSGDVMLLAYNPVTCEVSLMNSKVDFTTSTNGIISLTIYYIIFEAYHTYYRISGSYMNKRVNVKRFLMKLLILIFGIY